MARCAIPNCGICERWAQKEARTAAGGFGCPCPCSVCAGQGGGGPGDMACSRCNATGCTGPERYRVRTRPVPASRGLDGAEALASNEGRALPDWADIWTPAEALGHLARCIKDEYARRDG